MHYLAAREGSRWQVHTDASRVGDRNHVGAKLCLKVGVLGDLPDHGVGDEVAKIDLSRARAGDWVLKVRTSVEGDRGGTDHLLTAKLRKILILILILQKCKLKISSRFGSHFRVKQPQKESGLNSLPNFPMFSEGVRSAPRDNIWARLLSHVPQTNPRRNSVTLSLEAFGQTSRVTDLE
jgi:hypothetical protein